MSNLEQARCMGFPTYQIGQKDGARLLPRSQRCGMAGIPYVPSGGYQGAIGGIYSTLPARRGMAGFKGGYNLEVGPSLRALEGSALALGALRGGSSPRGVAGLAGLGGQAADRMSKTCTVLSTGATIVSAFGMQANTTNPTGQYSVQEFMDEQSRHQAYQTVGQVATGVNTLCQAIATTASTAKEQPAGTPSYATNPFAMDAAGGGAVGGSAGALTNTGGSDGQMALKLAALLGAAVVAGGVGYLAFG